MTPAELKRVNIERFVTLLRAETNPDRRETLKRLLALETDRPLSGYPSRGSGAGAPDRS